MSSLTTDRIRDHATKLGLTHLTEAVTQLVDRAEAGQLGYLDFLDLLLEKELGLREGRRFRNRLLHHCDVLAINGPSYRLKDRLPLVTGSEPMP